jgi:hypothetical protein
MQAADRIGRALIDESRVFFRDGEFGIVWSMSAESAFGIIAQCNRYRWILASCFRTLLDLGPDITPRAVITDKGYDAKANRDGARRCGICPVIPYKSNAVNRPAFFPKALYKARARIEQAVGKLKRFKRIALRCEKTAINYGSFVALTLGLILIKSVHKD